MLKTIQKINLHHPISLPCVVGLIFGIIYSVNTNVVFTFVILFLILLIFKKYKFALLFSLFFLAGYAKISIQAHQLNKFYNQYADKEIDIIGKIYDINDKQIIIETERIRNESDWQFNNFNITIKKYKNSTDLKIGDLVFVSTNKIKQPAKNIKLYLLKINYTASCFSKRKPFVICKANENFWQRLHNFKNNLLQKIHAKLYKDSQILFSTIFLGKNETDVEIKNEFLNWGISHYLARSGLHVVIIIFLLENILSLFFIGFKHQQLVSLFLMSIYYILSFPSIPFVRAFSTFLIYKFSNLFDLNMHLIHIFYLVCIFVLIYNPFQLFCLDFQLSFALTYALIIFAYLKQSLRVLHKYP